MRRIPVILDTDIGADIDDTWALALMLKSPELDIRLVTTEPHPASGDTLYRASIVARLLEVAGRSEIPVGVGLTQQAEFHQAVDFDLRRLGSPQLEWVEGYDLESYPGTILEDGVAAIVDTIMASDEMVTLVCIGGVPNIAAALMREPGIAERARFVGMHGSIRKGKLGSDEPSAEANVRTYPHSLQRVFAAPWEITITPLDTCGIVQLKGERYRRIKECSDPVVKALMDNYRIWSRQRDRYDPANESSILFDTVAAYLAFSEELVDIEGLPVRVTDEGYTVIDPAARTIRCATRWKDLPAFYDLMVERLTGHTVS